MSRPRILVAESDRFSTKAASLLRTAGELKLEDLDRAQLAAAVAWADVLWVRLRNRIDAEVMNAGPNLKMIVSATTGLNHIDLEEAARRGIRILSLRGETGFLKEIRATAEHTLGLALALVRNLPAACEHVRDGGWNRDLFWGNELHGKTAGVVGYGRLGRRVAGYLQALGMRVLAADPNVDVSGIASGVALIPLETLLTEADLVTLQVSLTPETNRFFGSRQFSQMRPGAWFVNTSRGELVDEEALLDALRKRRLSGAALDVLSDERASGMANHPLVAYARENRNLMITPHIGGCAYESVEKTEMFLAEKLCRIFGGESLDR